MARLSKEEEKAKRLSELNMARVKRYYNNHPCGSFNVRIDIDKFNEIDNRLKADGITKKDFILKSFEKYVENGGF